jgi:hypothetical protein
MKVGDMVIEDGPCQHIQMKDFRDCFHRPGSVVLAFKDMKSYLVENRDGYMRRIMRDGLIGV